MTIETVLHHYRFDTSHPDQAAAYDKLRAHIKATVPFPVWTMNADFHCYSQCKPVQDFMDKIRDHADEFVTLETEHLFPNQWNSASPLNARLFNWAECVYANKHIREGYFLEQTDAMRAVLRDTLKCGYCGKQKPRLPSTPAFCPHCIDGEYLKTDDLNLTRLVPVCDTDKPRANLTDAERAVLVPLFEAAQIHGKTERGKARIAAQREKVATEYRKAISDATEKRDAATWIMDNAPGVYANWIFYTHTGKHAFGWRKPLSNGERRALLELISEFPFSYSIICEDGRTLEG